jgi:hypothetical protein
MALEKVHLAAGVASAQHFFEKSANSPAEKVDLRLPVMKGGGRLPGHKSLFFKFSGDPAP